MESSSFHTQLLSVMEVLAKAAVAEIDRRVDISCSVLQLEVSRSRSDIDLLQRKCELMEAELRRSRIRARRRVFHPPAAEIFSPLVKVVLNKERPITAWDRQEDGEAPAQPQQRADEEPVNEAEAVQIKEECADEDMWKNDPVDKLISGAEQPPRFEASQPSQTDSFVERYHSSENAADTAALVSPADGYDTFTEQQQQQQHQQLENEAEADPEVKHEKEEESDENAAPPLDSGQFAVDEADAQLWSTGEDGNAAADPSFSSYAEQQYEQIPPGFSSLSGLVDLVPRIHSVGKSHSVMVSAARAKRRARSFCFKRPQLDEGHGALCQINSADQSSIPPPTQHQYRDLTAHTRSPNEDLMVPNPAASASYRSSSTTSGGGGGFVLSRRMRTPWRSSIVEKRFSCTYCHKSFMRFSQLKEHLRSHTGEKPFSCMQCGRSFTKQCNLIRHAVVHSGEKPYECSLCGKCFTQRSSLKSHQKTAH
ncbi:zinc finger and SCAN domain-containing protein 20 [Scomber japonicus]|uniref:zinc finger and SCAN domain-containing protein 20 n=1 Tax=Scomber japonicus TaxID=13676 RepID=UPI00230506F6|nr:zinc finger and SCAN domain-containing protein 20 [Scomber japonicus]